MVPYLNVACLLCNSTEAWLLHTVGTLPSRTVGSERAGHLVPVLGSVPVLNGEYENNFSDVIRRIP